VTEGSPGPAQDLLALSPNGSAEELAAVVEKVSLGVQPDHPDDIAALVARFPGV